MNTITRSELNSLNALQLAERIDEYFKEDYISRYKGHGHYTSNYLAVDFVNSKKIQQLNDKEKNNALLLFYRSKFQIGVTEQYYGYENSVIYEPSLDTSMWNNPHIQIRYSALRQASIISSRIVFESLMECVYFVEEKSLIPGSKSKIGKFRKWCNEHQNTYGWLIFYLIELYRFDRALRTPEMHGLSSIAIEALYCSTWPNSDNELNAMNIAQNIWQSILGVFNENEVNIFYNIMDTDLQKELINWKTIDLDKLWKEKMGKIEI